MNGFGQKLVATTAVVVAVVAGTIGVAAYDGAGDSSTVPHDNIRVVEGERLPGYPYPTLSSAR